MIKLITERSAHLSDEDLAFNGVELSTAEEFLLWFLNYDEAIQLDTETNIIEGIFAWQGHLKPGTKSFVLDLDEDGNRIPALRECYVVQVGDKEGTVQWLFDVPGLKAPALEALQVMFNSDNKKIIHNALFDYTVIKWCFEVDINKIQDTYLMVELLHAGYEVGLDVQRGYNSLAGLLTQYKGITLSKEAQTSFTGEPLTCKQIVYAALDVQYLGEIFDHLHEKILDEGLNNAMALENSLVRSYGDAMCENLYLNRDEWQVNIDYNYRIMKESESEFYRLMREYFEKECKQLKFINPEDEYLFNWRSSTKKYAVVKYLYPGFPEGCRKVSDYKEYLKMLEAREDSEEDDDDSSEDPKFMNWLLDKDYESLETHLVSRHSDFLEEIGIFVPRDKVLINLNSPDQKLKLFRLIDPELQSTGKEVISKVDHPLAKKIQEYNKASKLHSSYGQNFLDCIDPDEMFRVKGFKQILSTGRSAMNQLQLLPGRASFRNPFKPNHPDTGTRDDGHRWRIIGVDYCSQEAAVAAVVCGEQSLIDAIQDGCDFHSTCASLMFPEEWKKLGGDPKPMGKPKDKTLLKLRGDSKSTSFGLFYGKSAIGLGDTLGIPATTKDLIELNRDAYREYMVDNEGEYYNYYNMENQGRDTQRSKMDFIKKEHIEGRFLPEVVTADDLIARFFRIFPNIKITLDNYATTGVTSRKVRTPGPIGRLRYFPVKAKTPAEVGGEVVDSGSEDGSIRRASQNSPIQGASADMTKYAVCIMKKYIEDNNLQDRIKFCLPIHDEIIYIAREDFDDEALDLVILKMEEAATFILGNNLLKAEGAITDQWEK